jgi:hypothetical protein
MTTHPPSHPRGIGAATFRLQLALFLAGAGGVVADRHPTRTGLASVLLAAVAAVALIPLVRGPAIDLGWMLGVRAGGLRASTVLFLPPLFLLGMVSPYAIRLETESITGAGRTAGRLYAISTLGSVTGATLAGFVLVPSFRVPTLLASVAVTLVSREGLAVAKTAMSGKRSTGNDRAGDRHGFPVAVKRNESL